MNKHLFLLLALPFALVLLSAGPPKKETIRVVEMRTNMGTVTLKLYNETPAHRDNFLKLVNEQFYDSLLFHRVIKDFMIQGGDPDSKRAPAGKALGNGGLDYRVPAEFNEALFHRKGALAAARDNNPDRASSSCQFYIVHGRKFTDEELDRMESQMKRKLSPDQRNAYKTVGGAPHLDMGYTVYGEVIQGLDVIDKIATVKTAPGDRPLEDVRILSIKELKPMKVKPAKKVKSKKQT